MVDRSRSGGKRHCKGKRSEKRMRRKKGLRDYLKKERRITKQKTTSCKDTAEKIVLTNWSSMKSSMKHKRMLRLIEVNQEGDALAKENRAKRKEEKEKG